MKFVLFVVGKALAPTLDDTVSREPMAVVGKEKNMENLNWSKFILDNLVKSICEEDGNRIAGCALFLMVYEDTPFKIALEIAITINFDIKEL